MYHCYHPSDGYCILGMVIIGGIQGVNAVLPKSRTQKADICPILHWKHPVLGQFWESDNQPSIRNHYQEVSEEYCILGMMQFGSVMAVLYDQYLGIEMNNLITKIDRLNNGDYCIQGIQDGKLSLLQFLHNHLNPFLPSGPENVS